MIVLLKCGAYLE